jgi:protein-S-isoprenylcysteine O-methyltransferase Ste14
VWGRSKRISGVAGIYVRDSCDGNSDAIGCRRNQGSLSRERSLGTSEIGLTLGVELQGGRLFYRKVLLSVFWNTGTYGAALFLAAGTFDWWRGWVLVGMIAAGTLATMLLVFRTRPDLLRERMKGMVQKGQPVSDRVLVLAFLVSYMGSIAFIGLDVFQLHLLPEPNVWVSSTGLVLVVVGWVIIALVFRENAFAAPVVKHQATRGHKVVDTGVYSVVRHPMYAGIFVFSAGMALWLESYAGALMATIPISVLALRIVFEERFLRKNLLGYDAYSQRVRYRLVPLLW